MSRTLRSTVMSAIMASVCLLLLTWISSSPSVSGLPGALAQDTAEPDDSSDAAEWDDEADRDEAVQEEPTDKAENVADDEEADDEEEDEDADEDEDEDEDEETVPSEAGEVRELLEHRLDLNFDETALRDVLELFANQAGVAMHVQWNKLEEIGVPADMPVTVRLQQVRAALGLDLILDQVNSELTHYVVENQVIVSTREDEAAVQSTRVYDVRELLKAYDSAHRHVPTPGRGPQGMPGMPGMGMMPGAGGLGVPGEAGAPPAGAGAGMAGGLMAPGGMAPGMSGMSGQPSAGTVCPHCGHLVTITGKPPRTAASELIDLLQNAVAPDSWAQAGGAGAVHEFAGMLVVLQTERAHAAIAELLEELESHLEQD